MACDSASAALHLPMVIKCQLCSCLSASLTLYVSHLRIVHSGDQSFRVVCGIGSCSDVFTAFAAYNSHVYRHHREALGLVELYSSAEACPVLDQTDVHALMSDTDEVEWPQFTANDVTSQLESTVPHLQSLPTPMRAEKFLLSLREGYKVSQVALMDIIAVCNEMCVEVGKSLQLGIKEKLVQANVEMSVIEDIFNIPVHHPFEGVNTIYRFEKFCIDHLNCLEPKEISYNEKRWVNQFSGSKRRKVLKEDYFYYVPFLESLANILTSEDVMAEVLKPHINLSNDLIDFRDGSLFQSHSMFSSDPDALQVVAYYDELEVVNPIGTYVKKHKLGCMFYFLANVRPQYRSTLRSIQLLAVGKYEDILKYGVDQFLLPFIEDLKTLYCNGITVPVGGKECVLHGSLLAFLADNLAAHFVGGFKQSMSFALRICRGCMITREQSQDCFQESGCLLRTAQSHFEQCSLLVGPLSDHYSTSYGINRLSVLEEVPEFSVTKGLPHDIMHDLFEGVVPKHMRILLRHCVSMKYFSIEELNERIHAFDFMHNRPSVIDVKICHSESKVKQSASQMMALCHEFPLLLGDKIPDSDVHWHLFLVLLKICGICVAPSCSPDLIAYLSILIEEYLHLFRATYPNTKLIPKQHYMVHYPSQMERFGPLIHAWTMRQEAKLSFIKRVSRSGNYKNVGKTVARRHQFWMCYQMQLNPCMLTPQLEVSPKQISSLLSCEDLYIQHEIRTILPSVSLTSNVLHPDWVNLQSSHFCKGLYVMLKFDTVCPLFGKIFDLVTFNNSKNLIIILCVIEFYGNIFFEHYNAFSIKTKGVISAFDVFSLADHRPFYARLNFCSSDPSMYITLPYYY